MSSFNWGDYFSLAKSLAKKSDEASLRSSVSRAYYAAFCTARNHAASLGFRITATGKDHQLVERFYSGQANRKIVGLNLGRLRLSRNQCDYRDSVSNLHSIAQLALLQAQKILRIFP